MNIPIVKGERKIGGGQSLRQPKSEIKLKNL